MTVQRKVKEEEEDEGVEKKQVYVGDMATSEIFSPVSNPLCSLRRLH